MRNVITLHFWSVQSVKIMPRVTHKGNQGETSALKQIITVRGPTSVPLVKTEASGGRLTAAHQRQGYRGIALISQPQPEGPRGERRRRQSLLKAMGLVIGAALPVALQCDGRLRSSGRFWLRDAPRKKMRGMYPFASMLRTHQSSETDCLVVSIR